MYAIKVLSGLCLPKLGVALLIAEIYCVLLRVIPCFFDEPREDGRKKPSDLVLSGKVDRSA